MIDNDNDTTRTYSRTLAQAFPHAPDPVFEDEMQRWGLLLFSYVLTFFLGFLAALILM
jgi:hypothetical protein